MEKANPDVIIVLTPHGTRINNQFSISDSERMEGMFEENDSSFTMERVVDPRTCKGHRRKSDLCWDSNGYD